MLSPPEISFQCFRSKRRILHSPFSTVSVTNASLSRLLFDGDKLKEEQFNEYLFVELLTLPSKTCEGDFPDCKPAHYQMDRANFITWKMHQKFPYLNGGWLANFITNRLEAAGIDPNEPMKVCVRCFHYLMTEKRINTITIKKNKERAYPEPPLFAALPEADAQLISRHPVGFTI